jgi:hypothetical protein
MRNSKSLLDLFVTSSVKLSFGTMLLISGVILTLITWALIKGMSRKAYVWLVFMGLFLLLPFGQPVALIIAIFLIIKGGGGKVYSNKRSSCPKILVIIISMLVVGFAQFVSTSMMGKTSSDPYVLPTPLDVSTSDISVLKQSLGEKLTYIENKSGLMHPYNHKRNAILKKAVKSSSTLVELENINSLISNTNAGLHDVTPLSEPLQTFAMQIEQGYLGWYWFYGTFQEAPAACYFIALYRSELGNEAVRKKLGLKLGETTVYSVGVGIGYKNKWVGNKTYTGMQGTFKTSGRGSFSFSTKAGSAISLNINTKENAKIGTVQLDASWEGNSISAVQTSNQLPYFNMPNGCAPCAGGQGTLYWSWTAMKSDATLTIAELPEPVVRKNGQAWIDVQWGGSNMSRNAFFQSIANVQRLGSPVSGQSLGKYIWLNIHMNDENVQYMFWQFLEADQARKAGDEIVCFYNMYTAKELGPKLPKSVTVTIKEMSKDPVSGTDFPSIYEFVLPHLGTTVTLDSTMFGIAVIPEIGNIPHWNGSALLLDADKKVIGTGFLEAAKFESLKKQLTRQIEAAGVPASDLEHFTESEITFGQMLPSWYAVMYQMLIHLFQFVLFVLLIVFLVLCCVRR